MRTLLPLLFLLAFDAGAQSYEVSHRGHSYSFTDSGSLTLKKGQTTVQLEKLPCSELLRTDLAASFRDLLSLHVLKVGSETGYLKITTGPETFYVPEDHENGLGLQQFPDTFIKSYLIHKKLCRSK